MIGVRWIILTVTVHYVNTNLKILSTNLANRTMSMQLQNGYLCVSGMHSMAEIMGHVYIVAV